MERASQRACLARWMSAWSLLSHWPLEGEECDDEDGEVSPVAAEMVSERVDWDFLSFFFR